MAHSEPPISRGRYQNSRDGGHAALPRQVAGMAYVTIDAQYLNALEQLEEAARAVWPHLAWDGDELRQVRDRATNDALRALGQALAGLCRWLKWCRAED